MKTEDIQWHIYSNAVAGATQHVTGYHVPSGLTAQASHKSEHKAKTEILLQLAEMMVEFERIKTKVPTLVIERDNGDARCNFCDGPMPCNCPPPTDIDEIIEKDLIARAKYTDLLDERNDN